MKFGHNDLTLALITLFGSLALVDVVTTTFLLQRGGTELNIFMASVVQNPVWFLGIKILGLFTIVVFAGIARLMSRRGDLAVLSVVCGMSVVPAISNSLLLLSC